MDIENKVGGYFPVVSRHMARQGIEVFGLDDWAQSDVFEVSDLRHDKIRDRTRWRTALRACWLLSSTAAMGEQGIFVKYKSALHNVARNYEHELKVARNYDHELNKLAMLSLGSPSGPMT